MHHHENPLIFSSTSIIRKKEKFALHSHNNWKNCNIFNSFLSLAEILSSKKNSIMAFSFNFISSRKHKTLNFSSGALLNERYAVRWCKPEHYFHWDRYLLRSLKGKAQLHSICSYSDVKWENLLRLCTQITSGLQCESSRGFKFKGKAL